MPALFIYLIKVNVALLIFCLGYYAVLRHLTFYTLNRIYLVTAIVVSTIYPKVDFTAFFNRHQQIQVVVVNWQEPVKALTQSTVYDVWYWMQVVFWIGVVVFGLRLITQLISLYHLHKRSESVQLKHYMIRVIKGNINPFSFWRSIYINPENHSPNELDAILEHEQIHVNEWHTLDILLGEISSIFYWFNPGIWLMKRAIRENIEFITDRKILQKGVDSKSYQYSLLNVNFGAQSNAIVNHFNISTIKKRIIMMNAKRSSSVNITRYVFLIPVVMVLLLAFSVSKAELKKSVTKSKANVIRVFKTMITKIDFTDDAKAPNLVRKQNALLSAVSTFIIQHDTLPKVKIGAIDTNKKWKVSFKSVTGTNEPDVYIDGVKAITGVNSLDTLDPNTISSINVIKDGSTSTNGAIYIITKGHEPKIKLSSTIYYDYDTTKVKPTNGKSLTEVVVRGYGSTSKNDTKVAGITVSSPSQIKNIRINGVNTTIDRADFNKAVVNGDTVYVLSSAVEKKLINGNAEATQLISHLNFTTGQSAVLHKDSAVAGGPYRLLVRNGQPVSLTGNGSVSTGVTQSISIRPSPVNFNNKLIIINGKPATEKEMKKVSADKIESVNNLSGADATATYGDKGKNGVIVITTKK